MLVAIFTLLAQAAPAVDPLSGGAGWVGTGLLGSVLAWLLLVHLPSKDKQIKQLIDDKDAHIKEVLQAKDARIKDMAAEFRADLAIVVEHCRNEAELLTQRFSAELAALRQEVLRPVTTLMGKLDRD